jgi:hypothetical protein
MEDGRMFTDYRPKCISNYSIPALNEVEGNYTVPNSYEYRQYLINNAQDIMNKNKKAAYDLNSCGPCMKPYDEGTMLPEQRMIKCDASKCSFHGGDANGLGLGRKYNTMEPSQSHLDFVAMKEKEQLSWQKPTNYAFVGQEMRSSVPGGFIGA